MNSSYIYSISRNLLILVLNFNVITYIFGKYLLGSKNVSNVTFSIYHKELKIIHRFYFKCPIFSHHITRTLHKVNNFVFKLKSYTKLHNVQYIRFVDQSKKFYYEHYVLNFLTLYRNDLNFDKTII